MCLLKPTFLCEPEKIVGLHRLPNGKRELLVRWKNMTDLDDTWEPEELFYNTAIHREFLVKVKINDAKRARKNAVEKDAKKPTAKDAKKSTAPKTAKKCCIHCGKVADD